MAGFFKNFGKGILYVVAFPFILVGLALYAVFGLGVFFFQLGKLVYLFFTGRTINSDFEEDIAAKAKLQANEEKEEVKPTNPTELSLYPSDSPVYSNNEYTSPVFEKKEEEVEPIEVEEEDDNNVY